MDDLSPAEKDLLLEIYIGQNIRNEGILQSEIEEKEQARSLLSKGLIRENHWCLYQFLTTAEGSRIGMELVEKGIQESKSELQNKLNDISKKTLGFIIKSFHKSSEDGKLKRIMIGDWE